MRIAVIVPTYRRPSELLRCLTAIAGQERPADAVIVVCRFEDGETRDMLCTGIAGLAYTVVNVDRPGVVAALNHGLEACLGVSDVVAMTDDDAAPRSDWLKRIEQHYTARPDVGGVGGRDFLHGGRSERDTRHVGKVQWFGRLVGNFQRGIGPPRPVDFLKGVNMSFRTAAIEDLRFDERLRGDGAQVHNELAFSFAIRRKGWLLLFDPAVAVDHYHARRFDEDQRIVQTPAATSNAAFNETLILLEYLPKHIHLVYLTWAVLIGARDLPGIVQSCRLTFLGSRSFQRLPSVISGRLMACKQHYRAAKTSGS